MPYYVRTFFEANKFRCRMLPNQTIKNADGELVPVGVQKNVQCDRDSRAAYPTGAVFVLDDIQDGGSWYKTSDRGSLVCVESPNSKKPPNASAEQMAAYQAFKSAHNPFTVEPEPSAAPPQEVKEDDERVPIFVYLKNPRLKLQPPTVSEGWYVDPDIWFTMIYNVRNRIPTMLTGPTGSGKTDLIRLVLAPRLKKNVFVMDMGNMLDPLSGLLGTHRLTGNGKSEFDYAPLTKNIQTPNSIIIFDELSRAPAQSNNILFPCLDSRRELPVDIADSNQKRSIPVEESVTFFATANIGNEYTGTMNLDRALQDRFFVLEVSYIPQDIEEKILVQRTQVDPKSAAIIANVCYEIRERVKKGTLSTAVSTRHSLQCSRMVYDGMDLVRAMQLTFLPLFENSSQNSERSKVAPLLIRR